MSAALPPARPTGFTQLYSSFAEIWDEVLPSTPQALREEYLAQVVAARGPAGPPR